MADYHGDLIYGMKPLYVRDDRGAYGTAMILLVLFGITGAHRFYLGQHGLGWLHLSLTFITAFVGFGTLELMFVVWATLAHVAICAAEFVYMAINLVMMNRRHRSL